MMTVHDKATGQVLVIGALLIPTIVLLSGVIWATLQYRADDIMLATVTRTATLAGATAFTPQSLAGNNPALDGCTPGYVCPGSSASTRALSALRSGLLALYPQPATARVNVAQALANSTATVYDGTLTHPINMYHYPTLCLKSSISIGLIEYDGIAFAHDYVNCAQLAS